MFDILRDTAELLSSSQAALGVPHALAPLRITDDAPISIISKLINAFLENQTALPSIATAEGLLQPVLGEHLRGLETDVSPIQATLRLIGNIQRGSFPEEVRRWLLVGHYPDQRVDFATAASDLQRVCSEIEKDRSEAGALARFDPTIWFLNDTKLEDGIARVERAASRPIPP